MIEQVRFVDDNDENDDGMEIVDDEIEVLELLLYDLIDDNEVAVEVDMKVVVEVDEDEVDDDEILVIEVDDELVDMVIGEERIIEGDYDEVEVMLEYSEDDEIDEVQVLDVHIDEQIDEVGYEVNEVMVGVEVLDEYEIMVGEVMLEHADFNEVNDEIDEIELYVDEMLDEVIETVVEIEVRQSQMYMLYSYQQE